jgi:hypothetical protein
MVDHQQQPIPPRVQAVTGIAPVRLLVEHVDAQSAYEHRNDPSEVSNGVITRDGQPYCIGDDAYPVAVAVARLHLAGVALPGEVLPAVAEDGSAPDGR